MNRKQLVRQRERVEAQMRWAEAHCGDQELLDLLRLESDHLFAMIGQSHSREESSPSSVIDVEAMPVQSRQ
jgi:hypothetical protein